MVRQRRQAIESLKLANQLIDKEQANELLVKDMSIDDVHFNDNDKDDNLGRKCSVYLHITV